MCRRRKMRAPDGACSSDATNERERLDDMRPVQPTREARFHCVLPLVGWRMRGALIAGSVLSLAVLGIAIAREVRAARREEQALSALDEEFGALPHFLWFTEQRGAGAFDTQFGSFMPRWLRRRVGERVFDHVRQVEIHHADIDAADLNNLAQLRSLRILSLYDCRIHEGALDEIAGLPRLADLGLAQTNITDVGVALLGLSTSIKWLSLSGTNVGDAGLARLERIPSLRRLDLTLTRNLTVSGYGRFRKARPDVVVEVDEAALRGYQRPGQ